MVIHKNKYIFLLILLLILLLSYLKFIIKYQISHSISSFFPDIHLRPNLNKIKVEERVYFNNFNFDLS